MQEKRKTMYINACFSVMTNLYLDDFGDLN
jgi:hypothetical protein